MIRRVSLSVSLTLTLTVLPLAAQIQEYAAVVPSSARSDAGLFTVHRVGAQLLFEIPDSLLGRDMIIMSRFARAQSGLADGGAMMAPNIVVRWERRDDRIVLRGVSHSTTAHADSPLALRDEPPHGVGRRRANRRC